MNGLNEIIFTESSEEFRNMVVRNNTLLNINTLHDVASSGRKELVEEVLDIDPHLKCLDQCSDNEIRLLIFVISRSETNIPAIVPLILQILVEKYDHKIKVRPRN